MADASRLSEEQRKELEKKLKSMSPEQIRELQKQQCIFCQIVSGKIPNKKIYEDEFCLAVLDINPATRGHLLLLPKEHYTIMPQIPRKELEHLFSVAKLLSRLLLRALHVSGTNIFLANGAAAGQRTQHFLIHLLPRKEGDHLLPAKDKLIEPSLPEKVKKAVQDRLLELINNELNKELKKELSNKKPTALQTEKEPEKAKKPRSTKRKAKDSARERVKSKEELKEETKVESAEEDKEKEQENNRDPTASIDEIAELFK